MLKHAQLLDIKSTVELRHGLEYLIIKARNGLIETGEMIVPVNQDGTITDDYFEPYTLERVKLALIGRLHTILSNQKRHIHHIPTLHGAEKLLSLHYFTLGYQRVSEESFNITLEHKYPGRP